MGKKYANIKIDTPSGFKTNSVFVFKNGKPFYWANRPVYFNLPQGEYEIIGEIKPAPLRKFKLNKVVKPERIIPVKDLEVYFSDNPHKATIDLNSGKVLIDKRFKDAPEFVLCFILAHEKAHFFYETEKYCDLWAQNYMLISGYNPSQTFFAAKMILGDKCRMNFIHRNATKIK